MYAVVFPCAVAVYAVGVRTNDTGLSASVSEVWCEDSTGICFEADAAKTDARVSALADVDASEAAVMIDAAKTEARVPALADVDAADATMCLAARTGAFPSHEPAAAAFAVENRLREEARTVCSVSRVKLFRRFRLWKFRFPLCLRAPTRASSSSADKVLTRRQQRRSVST